MSKVVHKGMGVHLKVADLAASREFYERMFDLEPVFGYGSKEFRESLPEAIPSIPNDGLPGAPEKYNGLVYEPTSECPFEIAEGHIAVPDQAVYDTPVQSPKISAMVRVESLVPLIVDKEIRPSFPVRHYYWGTIEMAIKDPDGFVLVFIAPFSEEELAELQKVVSIEQV